MITEFLSLLCLGESPGLGWMGLGGWENLLWSGGWCELMASVSWIHAACQSLVGCGTTWLYTGVCIKEMRNQGLETCSDTLVYSAEKCSAPMGSPNLFHLNISLTMNACWHIRGWDIWAVELWVWVQIRNSVKSYVWRQWMKCKFSGQPYP